MVILRALPLALLPDTIQFEVTADKDLMKLFGLFIYALSMPIALVAGDLFFKGTFDLDGDGLSEALLFSSNQIRYVEIQSDGSHETLWKQFSSTYSIADVLFFDINNDGKNELIALANYLPENREVKDSWLLIYTWNGTGFDAASVEITGGVLLHPNHGDFNPILEKISVAVGSPDRSVKLLTIKGNEKGYFVKIENIDLPEMLHNGIGHIFTRFMNIDDIPHLAVFSPEEGILKTSLISIEETPIVVATAMNELNDTRKLLGPAIQKTDFDGDNREELQLPFANGNVLTLSYSDTVIRLEPSKFNDEGLFTLNEDADAASINNALLSRVETGLFDQIDMAEETILDSVQIAIIPDDTLRLGEPFLYNATADTSSGFYSFKWLSVPPDRASFNPYTGNITWVPTREQLGLHVFNYFTEIKIKEKLISDVNHFGDSHRIVPIIEESEQSFSIIVLDTVKPPVIYIQPPYKPFIVSVHTPGKPAGKELFVFEGVPPFHVMVDEHPIPDNPSISHSISANLGSIYKNKNIVFSYSSSQDSVIDFRTLTIEHDLTNNTFFAKIEPPMDSLTQELNPKDWQLQLVNYPKYLFEGFHETMRLDTADKGIFLYQQEGKHPLKNNSYISILTPLKNNEHNLSISLTAIELWKINGNIIVDSTGNKYVSTSIIFSGDFEPRSISAEIYTDIDMHKKFSELKIQTLEYMGIDSITIDSSKTSSR